MKLVPARLAAPENRPKITSPENANSRYGVPPDGSRAKTPKTTAKISAGRSGWSTTQATPSAVCLYRTRTSRPSRSAKRSRAASSSRRLASADGPSGEIRWWTRAVTGSAALEGRRHRPGQDLEVEPERPAVDVGEVELGAAV